MLDQAKLAKLSFLLGVASIVALCAGLVLVASCGSPSSDVLETVSPSPSDVSPVDEMPTPTSPGPTLTSTSSAPKGATKTPVALPEVPKALLGMWVEGRSYTLELGETGVYTLSYGFDRTETGAWSLQDDGNLVLEGQSFLAMPHGNLLLLDRPGANSTLRILRRVDDDGNLLAYEPARALDVPPVDSSSIVVITIADYWTGLSPLAPIEADFRLEPATGHFSGMAEFSVAGYTEAITRSVLISVPQATIDELLTLLASTPLEVGEYKAVFNHTDDFPSIIITVEGKAGSLGFGSESQARGHIPWRVVVDQDLYVTYADTPAQALALLDPYLAREVQEALFDLALARDQ